MKKNLLYFLAFSFFILNLAFLARASHEDNKKNPNSISEEKQSLKTKKKYKWEFSTSASLDINKESYNGDYKTTRTISIPVRIGYFISKNLEAEPEINYMNVTINPSSGRKYSYSDALLFTNFAFNFNTSSQVIPFILGGVGIIRISRESLIEPHQMITNTYSVLNAGAGIKWLAAQRVALRAEYRFINYDENGNNITHNKIFLGISIFF